MAVLAMLCEGRCPREQAHDEAKKLDRAVRVPQRVLLDVWAWVYVSCSLNSLEEVM